MKRSWIFLLACATALFLPVAAHSSLFAQKQAPAPVSLSQIYPIQDDESFQTVAKSFHKMPFNDPLLEFSLLLPKDWTSEDTIHADAGGDLDRKIMGELGRFVSPVIYTMRARVTIQSIKLDREISAANWLRNYMLSNSYSLQDKVNPVDDRKAVASGISTAEGKSNYVRMMVRINGDNAVIVRFECPLALKDALAFAIGKIMDSFQFVLTSDHHIEGQKIFSFAANALKISYPESWTANHVDIKDTHNMSMQLYNKIKSDRIDGLVRFVVIKRGTDTSLKKETDALKKYLTSFLGLEFKKLISSDKAPTTENRFLFSRYEVYQVSSGKDDVTVNQELRLAALGDKDWYVLIFLLTPSDSTDFYTWACNAQAFDMIIKGLH